MGKEARENCGRTNPELSNRAFQGGPNAGHIEFENQKYILKSIPSGIFQEGKIL